MKRPQSETFWIVVGVLLITLTAGLILIVGTAKPAEGAGAAPAPVRVLVTGDSITQGTGRAPHSWRFFVANPGINFVGDKRSPDTFLADNGKTAYATPFDGEHYAFAGGTICNQRQFPGQTSVGTQVLRHRPSVVVGAWGINDLRAGRTAEQVIRCYSRWIDSARAASPSVDFVIARLPWDHLTGERSNAYQRTRFNALLGWLARTRTTANSRIVLAQMRESYDVADTADGLHPWESGERKIAAMMSSSLAVLGVPTPAGTAPILPGNTFTANRAPAAPRTFVVKKGRKVTLRVILRSRGQHVTWCNGKVRTTRTGYIRFRSKARQVCRTRTLNPATGLYTWGNMTRSRR